MILGIRTYWDFVAVSIRAILKHRIRLKILGSYQFLYVELELVLSSLFSIAVSYDAE